MERKTFNKVDVHPCLGKSSDTCLDSARRTFRILFLLRKSRTGKNGLAPILARIATNGLKNEIYIQYHVNPAK